MYSTSPFLKYRKGRDQEKSYKGFFLAEDMIRAVSIDRAVFQFS